MNILRFDSVGGASGDMILAALIDLGADPNDVLRLVVTLGIGDVDLLPAEVTEHGFRGTRLTVKVPSPEHSPHRRLTDIRTLIEACEASPSVKAASVRVFERLAQAEASVHGTTPDQIHFHEVGAADSIIDIVGACCAFELLGVDAVRVGALPLGCGATRGAHGSMPIPVPATAQLLRGHPVIQTEQPFELVTPTGAALLMTWVEQFPTQDTDTEACVIERTGIGFGHRTLQQHRPNLLRASLLVRTLDTTPEQDACLVLECNLDDMVPELIGSLTEKLMVSGALDVFTTAVQMKKQRPGTLLTVLCRPEHRDTLVAAIFSESTTFGVREHLTQRSVLSRRHVEVQTPYGPVRVKIGSWRGRDVTRSPEHADCVQCAQEHGVPVRVVYESAAKADV